MSYTLNILHQSVAWRVKYSCSVGVTVLTSLLGVPMIEIGGFASDSRSGSDTGLPLSCHGGQGTLQHSPLSSLAS